MLLNCWEHVTTVDFSYDGSVDAKGKPSKKRWLIHRPNYEALAFYQARPEIFGKITARHVRILLAAIRQLNEEATPKKPISKKGTRSRPKA